MVHGFLHYRELFKIMSLSSQRFHLMVSRDVIAIWWCALMLATCCKCVLPCSYCFNTFNGTVTNDKFRRQISYRLEDKTSHLLSFDRNLGNWRYNQLLSKVLCGIYKEALNICIIQIDSNWPYYIDEWRCPVLHGKFEWSPGAFTTVRKNWQLWKSISVVSQTIVFF